MVGIQATCRTGLHACTHLNLLVHRAHALVSSLSTIKVIDANGSSKLGSLSLLSVHQSPTKPITQLLQLGLIQDM